MVSDSRGSVWNQGPRLSNTDALLARCDSSYSGHTIGKNNPPLQPTKGSLLDSGSHTMSSRVASTSPRPAPGVVFSTAAILRLLQLTFILIRHCVSLSPLLEYHPFTQHCSALQLLQIHRSFAVESCAGFFLPAAGFTHIHEIKQINEINPPFSAMLLCQSVL